MIAFASRSSAKATDGADRPRGPERSSARPVGVSCVLGLLRSQSQVVLSVLPTVKTGWSARKVRS
jgi:hypothetical protein